MEMGLDSVPTVASHKKYRLLIQAGSSGNFEGEITKSYTIGINLDVDVKIIYNDEPVQPSANVSFTYTGEEIKPQFKVVDLKKNNYELVLDKDYRISYDDDCINQGTKNITIYGLADYDESGNNITGTEYCGSLQVKNAYKIAKKSLADADVVIANIEPKDYTSQKIQPEPEVTWGERVLVAGEDFTYSYGANTNEMLFNNAC